MSDGMVSIPTEVAEQLLEDEKKRLSKDTQRLQELQNSFAEKITEGGRSNCQSLITEYEALVKKRQKLVDALQNAINPNQSQG